MYSFYDANIIGFNATVNQNFVSDHDYLLIASVDPLQYFHMDNAQYRKANVL